MSIERRRAIGGSKKRPASSEEAQYWTEAAASLGALVNLRSTSAPSEPISRANKIIGVLPSQEQMTRDGIDTLRKMRNQLLSSLDTIKATAEEEVRLSGAAIEHLSVLIALRSAPDSQSQEKRAKRLRLSSPATVPNMPPAPLSRSSLGPGATTTKDHHKPRREQIPVLLPGRKVAFRQPAKVIAGKTRPGYPIPEETEEPWILAVVKRCTSHAQHRYEVQDAEDAEDGGPASGQIYQTTIKSLIPLPDENASPGDAAHVSHYPIHPAGSTVLGLYPDTSCFYQATVVASPKDPQPGGRTVTSSTKQQPTYRLRFEDDNNEVQPVGAQWVVDLPR